MSIFKDTEPWDWIAIALMVLASPFLIGIFLAFCAFIAWIVHEIRKP